MNTFETAYDRTFQFILKYAQKMMKFRVPLVKESLMDIIPILKERGLKHPLVVSGKTVSGSPEFQELTEYMRREDISHELYTGVHPDPVFEDVYALMECYIKNSCDCIIAVGGGSVMDASKVAGALVSAPKKRIENLRGMLKVHKKPPFFIAVPTTAGTGSEATVAAVITNGETKDKFAVSDPKLIPDVAILDDALLKSLPKHIIANTGMDALSHALEAYVGHGGSHFTDKYSLESCKRIGESLMDFYENPSDDAARKNMLYASYYAGISFTRAYVGYVHALAHAVGGVYHKPHGYCIAILMPYVLEAYGSKAYKKLAALADNQKISGNDTEEKAKNYIAWIRKMNSDLGIPSGFGGLLEEKDLEFLACHAAKEANPWYPVPKELSKAELKEILILSNK